MSLRSTEAVHADVVTWAAVHPVAQRQGGLAAKGSVVGGGFTLKASRAAVEAGTRSTQCTAESQVARCMQGTMRHS